MDALAETLVEALTPRLVDHGADAHNLSGELAVCKGLYVCAT